MGDLIRSAIMYVAVVAIIIGVLKFYKGQNKVTIDPNDHTMEPQYITQGYNVESLATSVADYKPKDAVAYWVPGQPNLERVAWVVATQGQKVSMTKGAFTVDGQPFEIKAETEMILPEFRVPQGCVFLVHNKPMYGGEDSLKYGPIPFHNIKGKMPPP